MAKRYTGMVELEDTLIPPPPPIVEQSAVTSDPDVSDTNSEKEEATATQSEAGEESPEEDEDQGQGEEEQEDADGEDEEEEEKEDQEDQEFLAQPRLVEYFTDPCPKSNRHKWLVKFYKYLSRPMAGDKKTAIHLQHVQQMQKLLEAIDPDGDDIVSSGRRRGLRLDAVGEAEPRQ